MTVYVADINGLGVAAFRADRSFAIVSFAPISWCWRAAVCRCGTAWRIFRFAERAPTRWPASHAKAVRCLVRGRAIFIHAGRHSRRTAQRYKNPISIRRGMNATRPLADTKSCDHVFARAVDHRDIVRPFVAYEHEIVWGFGTNGNCACCKQDR